jgi:glycosyltransferase involved in cell wall biosynthesis
MVSVLIPVYNGERYLGRALDSVLNQTVSPEEVIVLDDGSTDGSADLASSYPDVKVIRQPNAGIGSARRRLVAEASGDWVAFLDHDDFWQPMKLAKQLPLTCEPNMGLVHTRDVFFFDESPADGKRAEGKWSPRKDAVALDHVLPDCRINTSSVLVRRQALMEAGNFDARVSKAEDWLMWLQLAARWDFAFVDEAVTWTYKRPGSASAPNSAWYQAERQVLEEHVLPNFDRLYTRFDPADRLRFRAVIDQKLGVIASLEAEALDHEGDRARARSLHLEAIRRSPTRKGAWLRLGKHLAGIGSPR